MAGMSKSDFIIKAINTAAFTHTSPAEYMEIISIVKRTGSTLEQLLKTAKSKGLNEERIQKALNENFKAEQLLWDSFVPGKY